MPTPTDLVTDLPADFEVFGQAVDTSLADLKGGTTDQVLAKNSNTDMDFKWVTSDDANAIQNSIVDAKGDLIAASANDTPARLAVGNNGEQIVADSSTSTGLRYQGSIAAGRNFFINGGQDVWQRGTSFASGGYTSDRWFMTASGGTLAGSRSTDVPTNPYFNYSLSVTGTSAQNTQIYQRIESANSTLFAGQSVTLSVWAKNSAGTTKLSYVGLYPTVVDNFASQTQDVAGDLTATSWSGSWTRYSVTFTANALATRGYNIILYRNGTETSTTLFTGMQLEVGSVATAFSRAGGTIQGELAACQRYYYRFNNSGNGSGIGTSAYALSTTVLDFFIPFPSVMRVNPTSIDSSGVQIYNAATATQYSSGTTTLAPSASAMGGYARYTHGSAVFTTGTTYYPNGGSSAYVGFGAEL